MRAMPTPTIEEITEYAQERAKKDGGHEGYYIDQALAAHEFYESNMEVCNARTWKDGNGNTVLNWKLKLVNNWLK